MKKLLIIIVIFWLHSTWSYAYNYIGQILQIEGRVYYKEKGNFWQKAKKGQKVGVNSYIKTQIYSRATILFKDGSKVFLGDQTIFSPKEFSLKDKERKGFWTLLKGKIRASIAPFKGPSGIRMATPTAIAGVKGTDFLCFYKAPVNVFYGLEGKVSIKGLDTPSVILGPGKMTENTRGRRPISPVEIPEGKEKNEAAKVKEYLLSLSQNVPVNWALSGKLPFILARWNINYGRYLMDKGAFQEALEVFQIAFDLTTDPRFRAESLLHKGTIWARFLKNIKAAQDTYQTILNEYPDTPQAETALYCLGLLYWDIGKKKKAQELLERYEILYPKGKHIDSVQSILREIKR